MTSTVNAIPAGEHEVTCSQVYTGLSKRLMPQLTLVLQDAQKRTVRHYLPLSTKDMTRTLSNLAILGYEGGSLSDLKVLEEFLRTRPIVGKTAMVKCEPYGEEGKIGVAIMWRVGEIGPWISEAKALHEAMTRTAEADAEPEGDGAEATEPSA